MSFCLCYVCSFLHRLFFGSRLDLLLLYGDHIENNIRTNLITMDMVDFILILQMDWLSPYQGDMIALPRLSPFI